MKKNNVYLKIDYAKSDEQYIIRVYIQNTLPYYNVLVYSYDKITKPRAQFHISEKTLVNLTPLLDILFSNKESKV